MAAFMHLEELTLCGSVLGAQHETWGSPLRFLVGQNEVASDES